MAHPIEDTLALLQDAMNAHREALHGSASPLLSPETAEPVDERMRLLRRLLLMVETQTGLEISRSASDRLLRAFKFLSLVDCAASVEALEACEPDDPAWLSLIESLTVHETYVMRDAPQLELFAARLPELIAEAVTSGSYCLRFWSAGCATGEEAYTIAALTLDALVAAGHAVEDGTDTKILPPWRIEVVGSDISRPVVSRAREGYYETGPLSSFRSESTALLRHFPAAPGEDATKPKRREAAPALKAVVRFEHGNIAGDPFPDRPFDAIFCRNVLIYFSARSRRRALTRLGELVRVGGFLVLGPTDMLSDVEAFETLWAPSAVIYRRRNDVDRAAC